MKNISALALLILSLFNWAFAQDSELLAEGIFSTNGINGSQWSIKIYSNGLVEAEEELNMLLLEGPKKVSSNISSLQSSSICSYAESDGFFSLPYSISPKAVSLGGPRVLLNINCGISKQVSLYPEFTENNPSPVQVKEIGIFKPVWGKLWQHSSITPEEFMHEL